MREATVGLLHPGEMGAAVGQCLAAGGHRVLWVPERRSPASAARAAAVGLTAGSGGLASLVREADVIVSVCPPHAALEVAREVAEFGLARRAAGFGGVYVDANAVSPATAREIARIIEAAGADYVDGGIIGTPPVAPGFIRLYLSGARAGEVQRLFAGGEVDARVLGGDGLGGDALGRDALGRDALGRDALGRDTSVAASAVAASAVKMAYASWTKGSAALLLAARGLARAEGVEEALLTEWGISQPGLADRSGRAAGSAAAKGWRWVAEMEEIAAAMAATGLPDGFHLAAAEIYRRAQNAEASEAILSVLLPPR
jgi:hypothetical protein